jgi:hypothetical protein
MLLGGNNNELFIQLDPTYIIGDYWSGQDHPNYFPHNHHMVRPDRKNGKYLNNQGGWIGTRRQILEWHIRWCRGSFLPYVWTFYLLYCGSKM